MNERSKLMVFTLPVLFLLMRLAMLIALPLEGLRGFGDLIHYYRLSNLGLPYLDYWVEFPPIFPFFSKLISLLASGREHVYDYLLVMSLSIAQMASLIVFIKLAYNQYLEISASWRSWVYLVILLSLPFGWWYFDPLVVLLSLLGIYFLIKRKEISTGVTLAIGTSLKLFPSLILPAVWKLLPKRKAIVTTFLTLGITILIYLVFYSLSPEFTAASLRSQVSKGSWETIWALIDGNFNTGNFGLLSERFDSSTALQPRGNQAVIPSYITVLPFLLLGSWIYWRVKLSTNISIIAFIGITWCLFLLWSPGWSPQWVLYLIPLILLTLPEREALLFSLILVMLNIMEWPLLLSRGYEWGLWITIPARTLIMVLLTWVWYKILFYSYPNTEMQNLQEIVA